MQLLGLKNQLVSRTISYVPVVPLLDYRGGTPKIADERLMYGEEMERMCIEGLRQIKQLGRKLAEIGGFQAKARG